MYRTIMTMACAAVVGTVMGVSVGEGGEGGAVAQGDRRTDVINQIKSDDERGRIVAHDQILSERKAMISDLIAILKGATKGADWLSPNTSVNLAIDALGELRAEEAVPELIRWLLPPTGPYNVRIAKVSPAGRALVKVGKPAVSELVHTLSKPLGMSERVICIEVLVAIEGRDVSMMILNKAAQTSADAAEKQCYAEAQRLLEERYPAARTD